MERKTFVIERSTWHRGQGAINSRLLVPKTGKMCCLGSISRQCGATEDQIRDVRTPARVIGLPATFEPLVLEGYYSQLSRDTDICIDLMSVNDDYNLSDADREAQITTLAATIGWDLTFVD